MSIAQERETALKVVTALREMQRPDSGWSTVMKPEIERVIAECQQDMNEGRADKWGGYQVLWQLIAKLENMLSFPEEQLRANEETLNAKV